MSKYKIYSKDGLTERCTVKKLEYNGTFMGERSISINIESSSPIQFDIYDYINYRGEKFELDYLPSENKKSTSNSVGDAFVYDLRFVSLAYELERCQMRDYVPFDNGVHYPSPLTIDFTGKASNLAERIQVCLDRLYSGNNRWEIRVVNDSENEKNISISQTNCWSAISLFNTEFGLNYYITGRVVVVGDTDSVIDYVFRFGKGNGLYSIERTTESEKGIVTRLIAFGGSTNLGDNYLRNKNIWPDSTLPASMYIPNLMLPNFEVTGIDYVESESVSRYGVREGVVIFEDVYPTIVGMKNSKGEEIDKLRSVEEITDETKSTFWITTYDLEFPNGLSTYIIDSAIPTINIKTGTLQGYGFEIASKGIEQLEDGSYKITLNKNTDNGFTVPNGDLNLSAGDKFVFTGITMPKTYIEHAENVLLQRSKEYLDKYSITNFGYEIGLDEIFVGRNQSIYDSLYEGKRLHIQDDDLNIDENIIIQSITIQEGESYLPIFRITLNNEVSASVLNRIQGQVSQLESTVTNGFTLFKWQQDQAIRKYSKPYSLWFRDGTTEYFTVDESGKIALISVALSSYSDIIAYAQNPELPLTLPIASPSNYGLVKYDGTTLKVDDEGRLYVASGGSSGIDFTVGVGLELTTDNYLNVLFGTTSNTACAGNDARLSDARRNPYSLSWSGYSSGSYDGASVAKIEIPNNTNQLTNGAGFISDANGFISKIYGTGHANQYLAGDGRFYTIAYSELSGTPDLSVFVTLNTDQTITGLKTFEQNILSKQDIIAYSDSTKFPTLPIASASSYGLVKIDGVTLQYDGNGRLYVAGGGSGGGISSVIPSGSGNAVTGLIYDGSSKSLTYQLGNSFLPLSGGTMSNTNLVGNLNADMLDGYHADSFAQWQSDIPITSYKSIGYGYVGSGWVTAGPALSFGAGSSYYAQIQTHFASVSPSMRVYNNGVFSDWREFAFTDSTVSAANRLSTTRYLWGQPFDGSGDVNGVMNFINQGNLITVGGEHWANNTVLSTGYDTTNGDWTKLGVAGTASNSASLILNYSGRVGIGTSSPEYKLDINGNVGVRGPMAVKGTIFMSLNTSLFMADENTGIYLSDYGIHWHNSDNTWHSSIMTCDGSVIYLDKPLRIKSDVHLTDSDQINGTQAGISLNYECGKAVNTTIWDGERHPIMRVFGEDRQVAIGPAAVESPRGTLNVDGEVIFESSRFTTSSGFLDGEYAYYHAIYGGYHGIDVCEFYEKEFKFKANGGDTTLFTLNRYYADFNGTVRTFNCDFTGVHWNGNTRFRLIRDGEYDTWLQAATDTTNDNGRLYMSGMYGSTLNQFNVWASTSNFKGSIIAEGDVTAYSDIRLKNRIESVNNVLDTIDTLDVFRYTWKDREDKSIHIGVSAQQVQTIYPEFVLTSSSEDGTDYLTVNYAALATCIAIQGIKELAKKGDERDKKIVSLKTEIEQLKERIKTLEAWS